MPGGMLAADRRQPLGSRRRPVRNDLFYSAGDGAAYSLMVGLGETYFVAFALALGASKTAAGLVATLPMLAGATLQLATPWAVKKLGSHRRWVVLSVSLQATAVLLMPLAWLFAGLGGKESFPPVVWYIYGVATLYWFGGLSGGPAWNTWIETVVPKSVRTNFFACRSRLSQFCTLAGFAIGGLMLDWAKRGSWELYAFCGILVAAAACRYLSATFLFLKSEPEPTVGREQYEPLFKLFAKSLRGPGITLVWYLLAMQVAVQISGPYFNPFMLRDRNYSYLAYMVMVGLGFLGKAMTMSLWGRVARQSGARRLLLIGGFSIIPIAAMWLIGDPVHALGLELGRHWSFSPEASLRLADGLEFVYYCFLQLLSGWVWAAYELAMLLMFFEAIPRAERTGMLTFYNWGNSAAMVVGSTLGGVILYSLGESHQAFLVLFYLSSLVRLCNVALLFLLPDLHVHRNPPAVIPLGAGTSRSLLDQPVLSSLEEKDEPSA